MAVTTPSTARRVRFWLVALFLIGIPIQFYLAGRGVFGASNYDAHKSVGDALHGVTVLALVVTFFGADMRNGRDIGLGVGLFVLMTIQAIIPSFEHPEVGAMHPLNALLLLGLAVHLLMRDRAPAQPAQVSNSA
jgi:uncharacterized membrane protein YhaH (DUF805 family)